MVENKDGGIGSLGDGEKQENLSAKRPADDTRYYISCPKRKNQARIAVTLCFGCEGTTGSTQGEHVEIGCGFPNSTRPKKKKRATKPQVRRIARDGLS